MHRGTFRAHHVSVGRNRIFTGVPIGWRRPGRSRPDFYRGEDVGRLSDGSQRPRDLIGAKLDQPPCGLVGPEPCGAALQAAQRLVRGQLMDLHAELN